MKFNFKTRWQRKTEAKIQSLESSVEKLTRQNDGLKRELKNISRMRAIASVKPRFKTGDIVNHYFKDQDAPAYKNVKILHVEIRKVGVSEYFSRYEPIYTFFCEDSQRLKDIREDGTILVSEL